MELSNYRCDGFADCADNSRDEENCEDVSYRPSGTTIPKDILCNGIRDLQFYEDEALCGGLSYGLYCGDQYITPSDVCTPKFRQACGRKTDKQFCSKGHEECDNAYTFETSAIVNLTRCVVIQQVDGEATPLCTNYRDQTNCTDRRRVAGKCIVDGFVTDISKYVVCNQKAAENLCPILGVCTQTSLRCTTHKHRLCDTVVDCPDASDEHHPDCLTVSERSCERWFGLPQTLLPLPVTWIKDGVEDCINGQDETGYWPTCGNGTRFRYRSNGTCSDVFTCRDGRFIQLEQLCDRVSKCAVEARVCQQSRELTSLQTTVHTSAGGAPGVNIIHSFWCLKGLEMLQRQSSCMTVGVNYPKHSETLGKNATTLLSVPQGLQDCRFVFGAVYLYLSCENLCMHPRTKCPLDGRPLNHDSCNVQFQNRVKSVVNGKQLTFLVSLPPDNHYDNPYFVCDNGNCLTYDRVCDLTDDCGDTSDEASCKNHFSCSSGALITLTKVCDGQLDCDDYSDECNVRCGKNILDGLCLKVGSWLIGGVSTLLNLITVFLATRHLVITRWKSSEVLINHVLLMFIGIGDLLTGIYLLSLGIFDIVHGDHFCKHQVAWLTSRVCSFFGVSSTLGMQISLFSMTVLSVSRVIGIRSNTILHQADDLTIKRKCRILAKCFPVVLMPLMLAFTPLIPFLEDTFVNGFGYDKYNTLFVGLSGKPKLISVLQSYHGWMRNAGELSWSQIRTLIRELFTNDYKGINTYTQGFYGNHAVCLFKFFVTRDDPQVVFAWTLLGIDGICFIFILCCYTYINWKTVKTTPVMIDQAEVNESLRRRNRKLHRKVSTIIATDFVAWIPFVLTALLHSAEVIDATPIDLKLCSWVDHVELSLYLIREWSNDRGKFHKTQVRAIIVAWPSLGFCEISHGRTRHDLPHYKISSLYLIREWSNDRGKFHKTQVRAIVAWVFL
eukprot:sb/3461741/